MPAVADSMQPLMLTGTLLVDLHRTTSVTLRRRRERRTRLPGELTILRAASRTCADILRASPSPTGPPPRSALVPPCRSPDTKLPSCAILAYCPPAPAKTGKFCTVLVSRNESSSRRPRESDIERDAELSDEAAAWCDKHISVQIRPRVSRQISRCVLDRILSDKQILFACNNSCSRVGTRSEGLSHRRRADAREEFPDPLDGRHQLFIRVGNAEPEITFAVRTKRSATQTSHSSFVQ